MNAADIRDRVAPSSTRTSAGRSAPPSGRTIERRGGRAHRPRFPVGGYSIELTAQIAAELSSRAGPRRQARALGRNRVAGRPEHAEAAADDQKRCWRSLPAGRRRQVDDRGQLALALTAQGARSGSSTPTSTGRASRS